MLVDSFVMQNMLITKYYMQSKAKVAKVVIELSLKPFAEQLSFFRKTLFSINRFLHEVVYFINNISDVIEPVEQKLTTYERDIDIAQ